MRYRGIFLSAVMLVLALFSSACSALVPEPTPQPPTETATLTPTPTETIVWFPPTETPTPIPTRALEPTPEYKPGIGEALLSGGFEDASDWMTGSFSAGNMAIANQSLTLAVQQERGFLLSLRSTPLVSDFYLQFTASPALCREQDAYGFVVRAASEYDYYRFLLNCSGQARAERVRGGQTTLMQDWMSAGILPGAPITLKVGLWAYNGEMRLFVNDVFLFSVRDPVFSSGQVGFFARAAGSSALTVTFSDLEIDRLVPNEIPPTPTFTPFP